MKRITIAFLLLATLACGQQQEEKNFTEQSTSGSMAVTACNFCTVSPEEFNNRMKSTPGQIVDVRTPDEVAGGKIPGSVNYNYNGNDFETQMQRLDKNKPVYVYCAAGGRSAKAMEWMKSNGFVNVVNLEGGMNAWTQNQLPVE